MSTKYTLMNDGSYRNNETGTYGIRPGNWQYADVQKWLENNTPDQEYTQAELDELDKKNRINILKSEFEKSILEPCECTTSNGYCLMMDAKKESSRLLNDGIIFMKCLNSPTIDIVDYYNHKHCNISIADAQDIARQQAQCYYTKWQQFVDDREAILSEGSSSSSSSSYSSSCSSSSSSSQN